MATVLLIDDEPLGFKPTADDLVARGHTVVTKNRGQHALDWLASNTADVVVLDIAMGWQDIGDLNRSGVTLETVRNDEWTGIRVYNEMKQRYPHIDRIIVRTVKLEDVIRTYIRANYPALELTAPVFQKAGGHQDAFQRQLDAYLAEAEKDAAH